MKINLGQGLMPIEGYIGVDSQPYEGVEEVYRFPPLPYGDSSIEDIYCGHCLEHMPPDDVLPLLRECHRVLMPGGSLTIVVPDAHKARLMAESGMLSIAQFAQIVCGAAHDDMPHRGIWKPQWIGEAMERAGFVVDPSYAWREDERVYDRGPGWQAGVRGMRK